MPLTNWLKGLFPGADSRNARRTRSRRDFARLRVRRMDERRVFAVTSVTNPGTDVTIQLGDTYVLAPSNFAENAAFNSPHQATVTWGDSSSENLNVTVDPVFPGIGAVEGASHQYNTLGLHTITISVSGLDGITRTDTINITVNAAPTVTPSTGTLAYGENVGPVAIDSQLAISDTPGAILTKATITIDDYVSGQDTLAFGNQLGITGSWDAVNGVLTLSGDASIADYQTALRSVTYANSSDDPNPLTRTISITVNDETSTSAAATIAVTITTNNDAPIVTTTGGALSYFENTTALVDGTINLSDDGDDVHSATLQITGGYDQGDDVLAFTNQLGITGSWNASSGTLTLSSSGVSVDDFRTALRSVTFATTSASLTDRTVTIVVNDATTASAAATRTISIQNDAPTLTVPGTQSTGTLVPLFFSSGNGNQISVDDVDIGSNLIQVTLSIPGLSGNLTLMQRSNLNFTFGDGVNDTTMTFRGTLADVNAALNTLRYNPVANLNGTVTLTVTVNDLGNSGAGGAKQVSATVDIEVSLTNDAPVNTVPSGLSTAEDTPLVIPGTNFFIDDDDAGNLPVQVTLTATGGTMTLNGGAGLNFTTGGGVNDATMTFTGTVAAVNAALAGMTFTPTSNFTGTATIRIVTNDQGNSGVPPAQLSDDDSFDIEVTPVNDAPELSPAFDSTTFTEDGGAVYVDSGITLTDVDDDDIESAVVQISVDYIPGEDELLFTDTAEITGSWDSSTGTLTLTGTATKAQYEAALRSVAYNNTSQNPNTTTRTVTIAVNDGDLDSSPVIREIGIVAVNDAPDIDPAVIPDIWLNSSPQPGTQLVTFNVSDVDTPLASLTYSVTSSNQNLVPDANLTLYVDGSGFCELYITPVSGVAGETTTITITFDDGAGGTVTRTFHFEVNNPPQIFFQFNGGAFVSEDTPLVQEFLYVGDAETDFTNLTVSVSSSNPSLVPGLSQVTYFPNSQYDGFFGLDFSITPDLSGVAVLTITISDELGRTASTTYTVTVSPVNDLPTADDQVASGLEDQAIVGQLLGDDGDIDYTQNLFYFLSTAPQHGTVTIDFLTGEFVYTPSANYSGTDYFEFFVIDDHQAGSPEFLFSSPARVDISITPVADDAAISGSIAGAENTAFDLSTFVGLYDVDGSEALVEVVIDHVPAIAQIIRPDGGEFANTLNVDGTKRYVIQGADFATARIYAIDNVSGTLSVEATTIEQFADVSNPDRTATYAQDVTLNIYNVPPQILAFSGTNVTADAVATISATLQDAPLDVMQVTITWGISTIGFNQQTFFSNVMPPLAALFGSYQFLTAPDPSNPAAPIVIQIDVTDKDGGVTSAQLTVDTSGTGIPVPITRSLTIFDIPLQPRSLQIGELTESRTTSTPPVTALFERRTAVNRAARAERAIILRTVSSRDVESEVGHRIPIDVLDDLPSFLRKLPDGHYRLYLEEDEFTPQRMLVDIQVFRGRAVATGDLQADRPPRQVAARYRSPAKTVPDGSITAAPSNIVGDADDAEDAHDADVADDRGPKLVVPSEPAGEDDR